MRVRSQGYNEAWGYMKGFDRRVMPSDITLRNLRCVECQLDPLFEWIRPLTRSLVWRPLWFKTLLLYLILNPSRYVVVSYISRRYGKSVSALSGGSVWGRLIHI